MGKKYFVTSDIHSFMDELMVALDKKGFDKDNKDHILCICGDLLDRGDKTVELFEFIKGLQEQDRLIYVRGNHEDLLFDCMAEIYRGEVPGSHHFSNGTI
jgi:predicted MPP superfamily phosphohydrolase